MGDIGPDPTRFFIVAIAASLGGIPAISQVLSALTPDFPGAILVIQHLERLRPSHLTELLARRTALRVKEARNGAVLQPGTVYVAPPDRHLLVLPDGTIALTRTPLVQYVRPSADLLFESIADNFHDRAIAVILTGTGRDGIEGAQMIHQKGGTVIAQSPETATSRGMPGGAIRSGFVHRVLPLNQIAPVLESLVTAGGGP
jgi:two-component system, chemotaxis family, protein-glutamate methylesterase/glutaminase